MSGARFSLLASRCRGSGVVVRPSRAQRRHARPELVLVDLAAGEPLGEDLLGPGRSRSFQFIARP